MKRGERRPPLAYSVVPYHAGNERNAKRILALAAMVAAARKPRSAKI